MNNLQTSILALAEAIRSMGRQTTIPKTRNNDRKKSGKTRRGATHKVNPAFRSRSVLLITPAEYRRKHMGVTHERRKDQKSLS